MPRAQLAERFSALWQRLGADDSAGVAAAGERLLDLYAQPHRAYHNLTHLEDVLAKLDWAQSELSFRGHFAGLAPITIAKMFDTIELALFYHDVIYDAASKDNEKKSRDMMLSDATSFGLAKAIADDAARLINMTAHHNLSKSPNEKIKMDERIMADCDLAILGASPANFKKYDAGIRLEYAHVPDPIYAVERAKILRKFLEMPRLFKTTSFELTYGKAARRNLTAALTPQSPPILGRIKKFLFGG